MCSAIADTNHQRIKHRDGNTFMHPTICRQMSDTQSRPFERLYLLQQHPLPCDLLILWVHLYWNKIASKWFHREFNLLFTLGSDKDQIKNRFRIRFHSV